MKKFIIFSLEVFLAAAAGMTIIVLPVIINGNHAKNSAVFLPVVATAVENMSFSTFGYLFILGLLLGLLTRTPFLIIGPAVMLFFPIWSLIDMIAGSDSHNLWPIEWFSYAIESLSSLAGAAMGRIVKRLWIKRRDASKANM
jgi:hypothetical protein